MPCNAIILSNKSGEGEKKRLRNEGKKERNTNKSTTKQKEKKEKTRPQGPVVIGGATACQTKEEKPAVGACAAQPRLLGGR